MARWRRWIPAPPATLDVGAPLGIQAATRRGGSDACRLAWHKEPDDKFGEARGSSSAAPGRLKTGCTGAVDRSHPDN